MCALQLRRAVLCLQGSTIKSGPLEGPFLHLAPDFLSCCSVLGEGDGGSGIICIGGYLSNGKTHGRC